MKDPYIVEKRKRMQEEFLKLIDKYSINEDGKIDLSGTAEKAEVISDLQELYDKIFIRK